MTGSDGLEEKGDKEVVLKDVWLDKGSPIEKENQDLIYENLQHIEKSSTSGLKTNTRNGSVMPLKTYLIACRS